MTMPSSPSTGSDAPELLWSPDHARVERSAIADFQRFLREHRGVETADYEQLWQYSTTDLAGFWGALADYFGVRWHAAPEQVLADASMPGAVWFPGGTLNYAEHALAAIPGRAGSDVAVIVTDESGTERQVTLDELRAEVASVQVALRKAGVQQGDRVAGLLPNGIHALTTFLAAAACGAVWSSCSPDFGPAAVIDRFTQIEPTVFVAVDSYVYGGKTFSTLETVRAVRDALPDATVVLVAASAESTIDPGDERAISWDEFTTRGDDEIAELEFVPVDFGAPLWVLYSSGTTGLPKPIVQSVGGILVEQLKTLRLHSDLGPGDRFFWFTTTGWMMWNYLVGGLLVGSTIVLYDGNPGFPDMMTLWRLAERLKLSYLGTSAPFIHACRAKGLTPAAELDLTSLGALGSTGAPLSSDGFDWIAQQVGEHVQICSVSGGTDLCTAIVGSAPTVPVWRGEISCRTLGAKVQAYDEAGQPLIEQVGELVITEPMPSMPISFWGDDDGSRLRAAYFEDYPGVWRHGDWIRITERGSTVIEGRSDATLNRGGVRMGTAEFYRVVEDEHGVADSLVIDTSSAAGEGDLLLFVQLDGSEDISRVASRLRATIRTELSPRHVPGKVIAVPSIPRTINGKKCEVPVKRILAGADVESAISLDALADPDGLEDFLAAARQGME